MEEARLVICGLFLIKCNYLKFAAFEVPLATWLSYLKMGK